METKKTNMRLKTYWLRKTPVECDLNYFKQRWFDNLGIYEFKPGFRKNRERQKVINYFHTETDVYLYINRLNISKASGVDLYKIPKNCGLFEKLKTHIVLNNDCFITNDFIDKNTTSINYGKPNIDWVAYWENGQIKYRDRLSNEYGDVIVTHITLPEGE